jgi:hypothetical protein
MDSSDLTPDQLRALTERLRPALGFLSRLQARMEGQAFPARDRAFVAVCEAQAAMQALLVELHYLQCPCTTGRRK